MRTLCHPGYPGADRFFTVYSKPTLIAGLCCALPPIAPVAGVTGAASTVNELSSAAAACCCGSASSAVATTAGSDYTAIVSSVAGTWEALGLRTS